MSCLEMSRGRQTSQRQCLGSREEVGSRHLDAAAPGCAGGDIGGCAGWSGAMRMKLRREETIVVMVRQNPGGDAWSVGLSTYKRRCSVVEELGHQSRVREAEEVD